MAEMMTRTIHDVRGRRFIRSVYDHWDGTSEAEFWLDGDLMRPLHCIVQGAIDDPRIICRGATSMTLDEATTLEIALSLAFEWISEERDRKKRGNDDDTKRD